MEDGSPADSIRDERDARPHTLNACITTISGPTRTLAMVVSS